MKLFRYFITGSFSLYVLLTIYSCKGKPGNNDAIIADTPGEMQEKSISIIQQQLDFAAANEGRLDSATTLQQAAMARTLYEQNGFEPLWCKKQEWLPAGDSLSLFIGKSANYGLFPADYHHKAIDSIRMLMAADTLVKAFRKDVLLWARADMMLTDGFLKLVHDIKFGRLVKDSITLRKDSAFTKEQLIQFLGEAKAAGGIITLANKLEPTHRGYRQLKNSIPYFLKNYSNKTFTIVPSRKDAINYTKALQNRLFEGGYISFNDRKADSAELAEAVKKFQKEKGITADGVAGEGTLRLLNSSDREKFVRIAISMDRYKMLPETMPERYIWVNAASNMMEVVDKGKTELASKVICGKARTRTPVLNGIINTMITYPQWVPPPSIVSKEILPAVKKNPGYLARKGFSLVDSKGETVDPYSVNWSRYSKGVPYRIVQGSGDANALGVMKFVFDNKYSVYLHDTNQRYLFGSTMRSLSHGCVRVQEWEKLAVYILRSDSVRFGRGNYTPIDSMRTWLQHKQKRSITVKNKLPVYIRYITCEGRGESIVFYDDVYAEDKMLAEKYFAGK